MNTSDGFKCYFDKVFDPSVLNSLYIIKGGSGTGKSTMMKRIGESFEKEHFVGFHLSLFERNRHLMFFPKAQCPTDRRRLPWFGVAHFAYLWGLHRRALMLFLSFFLGFSRTLKNADTSWCLPTKCTAKRSNSSILLVWSGIRGCSRIGTRTACAISGSVRGLGSARLDRLMEIRCARRGTTSYVAHGYLQEGPLTDYSNDR